MNLVGEIIPNTSDAVSIIGIDNFYTNQDSNIIASTITFYIHSAASLAVLSREILVHRYLYHI